MLFTKTLAAEKRVKFQKALKSGRLLRFPGAFSPLTARLIEGAKFEGVYVSGAVLSADLALPDIGLTTLTEVATRAAQIARVTELPSLVDVDTGFGEPMSAARTIQVMEEAGLSGCHLEDQVNPKRCGHLDGKTLIEKRAMVMRIKAAASARRDDRFLIMARTDARANEGLEKAIARAKAYVDAGADAIFPEALEGQKEFEAFRKAIKVPLLANMTEFGKTELLSTKQLSELGYNLVIYPVTTLRLAMKAAEDGLAKIARDGTQANLLEEMQTRKRLYEVLRYEDYNAFDQSVFNFKV